MQIYTGEKELAKVLHTSEANARAICDSGLIEWSKPGRTYLFTDEAIEEFLITTANMDISNPERIYAAASIVKQSRKKLDLSGILRTLMKLMKKIDRLEKEVAELKKALRQQCHEM